MNSAGVIPTIWMKRREVAATRRDRGIAVCEGIVKGGRDARHDGESFIELEGRGES